MNFQAIAEQLASTGYVVLDQPLPTTLDLRLLARCQDDGHERFQAARIGRGLARKQIHAVRGDVISWLEAADSADLAYLDWMGALRFGLNEALFMGLFDFECHYAIYEAGAGYAKHSDVLDGHKNRILSTVLYLNEDWQAGDGGELVLYDPSGESVIATVLPTFGTMIIFLSESFPHEVRTSHAKRRSIAGWFRVRELAMCGSSTFQTKGAYA